MPVTPYRYAGNFLAQAQSVFDPQKNNMGVLELNINGIVPGGKEILILSLEDFNIPKREVSTGVLPFLSGNARYAQRPQPLGNLTATFRDFPLVGTRRILTQWFNLVFEEESGLMLPMSAVKTTGHAVLFASDGTSERSLKLEGIFPISSPNEIIITYGGGEHLTMKVDFSVDRVVPDINLANPVQPVE